MNGFKLNCIYTHALAGIKGKYEEQIWPEQCRLSGEVFIITITTMYTNYNDKAVN